MEGYPIELNREELFDVNMMITVSVTVRGSADREQLAAAFDRMAASCEGLNTRIVIEKNGTAWYQPYGQSENSLHFTEKSLDELIHEQERKRFRLENGEYLRLFINDSEAGLLRLYFFQHHTGGDGKSLCYIIESFLHCLNGQVPAKRSFTVLKRSRLPKDSRLKLSYRCYVKAWNRRWERQKRVFGFQDMDRAYELFWKTHETEILLTSVDQDTLRKQKEECSGARAGFTSRFIAGLQRETASGTDAAAEEHAAGQNNDTRKDAAGQKTGLAVSIRNTNDRSTGNQVTGVPVVHRYESSAGFSGNAEEIDRKLRTVLASPKQKYFALQFLAAFSPSLLDAAVLEGYGVYHSRLSGQLAEVIHYGPDSKPLNDVNLSNLGNLDIPTEYGDFRIVDFLFIPPNVGYGGEVLGLVSVHGRLNIACRRYKKTKSVALITGASGGIGRAFVRRVMDEVDEIWAVGRNREKLDQLTKEYGSKIRPLRVDLSDVKQLCAVSTLLEEGGYRVKYLINNAGSGKMAPSADFSAEEIQSHINTHNTSAAILCNICIPFMDQRSHILNVASQSAFQPTPYINLYAACKAFSCSYSRALNLELQDRGITVTAVCPGWVKTDLLREEMNGVKVKFPHLAEPDEVAQKAIRDTKKGKDMSVFGCYVRRMQFYSKLLPHSTVMKYWVRSVKKYVSGTEK